MDDYCNNVHGALVCDMPTAHKGRMHADGEFQW